jgi:DNA-directed RNA polymerase specialized sigma24 family protein
METESANTSKNDEFLSYVEAGKILRVGSRTIHNYVQRGWLHAITINRRKKLIRRSVLQQFIQQAEDGPLPLAEETGPLQLALNI